MNYICFSFNLFCSCFPVINNLVQSIRYFIHSPQNTDIRMNEFVKHAEFGADRINKYTLVNDINYAILQQESTTKGYQIREFYQIATLQCTHCFAFVHPHFFSYSTWIDRQYLSALLNFAKNGAQICELRESWNINFSDYAKQCKTKCIILLTV